MIKIHQVAIKITGPLGTDDWTIKSREEFNALSNSKQLELILSGCIKFYDDQGKQIAIEEAIRSIGLA